MIKYKMQLLSEIFKSDICLRRAYSDSAWEVNVWNGAQAWFIELTKIKGLIRDLVFDAASNKIVEKKNEKFDVVALRYAMAMGSRLVLRAEMGEHVFANFQVMGVRTNQDDNPVFFLKAVNGGKYGGMMGLFENVSMTINIIAPPEFPGLLGLDYAGWYYLELSSVDPLTVKYDEGREGLGGVLTFWNNNDDGYWGAITAAAIESEMPVEFCLFRNSGSKKMLTPLVAKIESVKKEGRKVQVQLNNKGLKVNDATARKAVYGVESGTYKLKSIRALSGFPGEIASLFQISNRQDWSTLSFIPQAHNIEFKDGKINNKRIRGKTEYVLHFRLKEKSKVIYYNESNKMIKSKSTDGFISDVAEALLQSADNSQGWAWLIFKTASGEARLAEITELKRDKKIFVWSAKVELTQDYIEEFREEEVKVKRMSLFYFRC
jgi:hypothetical protein